MTVLTDWFEFDESDYPVIENETITVFEQHGDHQKIKHEFIETYMRIWFENVGYRSTKKIPSIDLFDLYAASGWATNESKTEQWPGSALILAKCFGEYPNSRRLFLNTYNPDPEIQTQQVELLKNSIRNLPDCPHVFEKTTFCQKEIFEATNEAISSLNRNFPSVWILDPYSPKQLPWGVVHSIASATGGYHSKSGEWIQKRPELIINLMTSVLQRFAELRPDLIKIAFDMNEQEWKDAFSHYEQIWKSRGIEHPTRHVILDIYLQKLSDYYSLPLLLILVPGKQGQIVYAMIHCTNNLAGHHLMRKKISEGFGGLKGYEWTKDLGMILVPTGGQKSIFSFS